MQNVVELPRDDSIPGDLPGFMARFSIESECEALLRRWKYGGQFRCPACDHDAAVYIKTRRVDQCCRCGKQVSLTSGTVMHSTKKPLSLWFTAMYLFVVSKRGISAMDLHRQLGISYPTAWAWLHKFRTAVGRRTTTALKGVVEADETWEGGVRKGISGRPQVGAKKMLVAAAIEQSAQGKGLGRVRLASLKDGSTQSLQAFLALRVAPGALLKTDDWRPYRKAAKNCRLKHRATNVSKSEKSAHEVLPGVHRVFSLLHRLLLGTHQGAVSARHLPAYLAEFEFRFNRRKSASRALLFQRLLSAGMTRKAPTFADLIGGYVTEFS